MALFELSFYYYKFYTLPWSLARFPHLLFPSLYRSLFSSHVLVPLLVSLFCLVLYALRYITVYHPAFCRFVKSTFLIYYGVPHYLRCNTRPALVPPPHRASHHRLCWWTSVLFLSAKTSSTSYLSHLICMLRGVA